MSKIHINSNGEPGVCKAVTKPCPFGDDSTHFSSTEEAVIAYSKAQEALGNSAFGKTALKPGEAFTYLETKDEADKVANLITNEGKYAAIIKHTSLYAIGEPDIDDYEDEDKFREALDEFREAIENEEVEFEEPSISGYHVRAFDSFEQAKEADPELWSGTDRNDISIEIDDDVDEVYTGTDINPYNSILYKAEVEFVAPKKKS
jgi:hypothetical protein